jgi:hypothetical protein
MGRTASVPAPHCPVCPNCGLPPRSVQFCVECGYDCSKWRHLPLRADWEAELARLAEYRAKRAASRERWHRRAAWLRDTPIGRLVAGVAVIALMAAVAVAMLPFPMGSANLFAPRVSAYELADSVAAAFSVKPTKRDAGLRVKSVNCLHRESPSEPYWRCDADIGITPFPDGTIRYDVTVADDGCWHARASANANAIDSIRAFRREALTGCLGR